MKKQKAETEKEPKRKKGPLLFIVFLLFLLIIGVAGYFLLSASGVDVKGKVFSALPFLNEESDQEASSQSMNASNTQNQEMEALQKKIKEKDLEIENLQVKLERAKAEMPTEENSEETKANTGEEEGSQTTEMKNLVRSYESMSPKNAALIISELKENQALELLGQLKTEALANILAKMEPDVAAKYTELLAEEANVQ